MEFKKILLSNIEDIKHLSLFATSIIKEYYDPLLGYKQNAYMLKKFQSVEAIIKQIEDGYQYYIIKDIIDIGFIAFFQKEDTLYLSKFYLIREKRNKGYGKKILSFIEEEARKLKLKSITLNVNRYNINSIKAYEALGFKRTRSEDNDIGHNYYMEDYVYQKDIR